ncbi:CTLH domain-containing protein [Chloropicon primus]|uniref:Macrophage erythroblast attacher n=1 Tax=Chloropicon primus TaxID=1764295 RepID=A0A5B8MGX6_9CHLO|nr:hypothetical protein A3770_02p14630 [Chloropicon primus]UPQ98153.1 CTLH domain-containing protein [Chloropicon primus]|mmetsp:Transcript_5904/g.17775  ORF Transcript_5904/g.17775 Transcript_5904/m.17775 type:complete len:441 (+) Transcript_5904:118-1440(+)|eukprot:QDZ18945.1 hypothetical protein A3770_02p14630 [Chloropicon primus]
MEVVESPFVRVPFEALKRAAKERKYIVEEVEKVMGTLKKHAANTTGEEGGNLLAAAGVKKEGSSSREQGGVDGMEVDGEAEDPQSGATTTSKKDGGGDLDWESDIEGMLSALGGLKRKLDDSTKAEAVHIARCKARIEHLMSLGAYGTERALSWNKKRMKRLVVDYLLRQGYHKTALQAVDGEENLAHLLELDIFKSAQTIVDSLKVKQCGVALEWCGKHRSKLKRIKSKLEFKLRIREFICLVQEGKVREAVNYSKLHLSQWAPSHMKEFQEAMATLVYGPYWPRPFDKSSHYGHLFLDDQWEDLVQIFKRDLYQLYALPADSNLAIHIQAGLSALKTPMSYTKSCSKEDPLSLEAFKKLSESLPYAKHSKSRLVCFITKQVMNEHNPPMVLPNGMVYSRSACEELAQKQVGLLSGKKIVCPRTGDVCDFSELKRAFPV